MAQIKETNSQNSSIVGNSKSRVKESSTAKMVQKKKLTKVDENLTTNGLRMPGSNWEKYKSLITESKTKNEESTNSTLYISPRKRLKAQNFSNRHEDAQSKASKQISYHLTEEPILTNEIAMDCEMVGIGDGSESMVARVSIVNKHGICVYDKYVKPTEKVIDYRSSVSGIYPHHLKDAEEFTTVQKEVAEILKGRLLIGHALKYDLEVLYLSHPRRSLRDTSLYKPFRNITNGSTPSLKKLTSELLGIKIQTGEHSSVEDSRSAMQLYMLYKKKWETEIHRHRR